MSLDRSGDRLDLNAMEREISKHEPLGLTIWKGIPMENVPIGMLFCAEVEGGRMVWADAAVGLPQKTCDWSGYN